MKHLMFKKEAPKFWQILPIVFVLALLFNIPFSFARLSDEIAPKSLLPGGLLDYAKEMLKGEADKKSVTEERKKDKGPEKRYVKCKEFGPARDPKYKPPNPETKREHLLNQGVAVIDTDKKISASCKVISPDYVLVIADNKALKKCEVFNKTKSVNLKCPTAVIDAKSLSITCWHESTIYCGMKFASLKMAKVGDPKKPEILTPSHPDFKAPTPRKNSGTKTLSADLPSDDVVIQPDVGYEPSSGTASAEELGGTYKAASGKSKSLPSASGKPEANLSQKGKGTPSLQSPAQASGERYRPHTNSARAPYRPNLENRLGFLKNDPLADVSPSGGEYPSMAPNYANQPTRPGAAPEKSLFAGKDAFVPPKNFSSEYSASTKEQSGAGDFEGGTVGFKALKDPAEELAANLIDSILRFFGTAGQGARVGKSPTFAALPVQERKFEPKKARRPQVYVPVLRLGGAKSENPILKASETGYDYVPEIRLNEVDAQIEKHVSEFVVREALRTAQEKAELASKSLSCKENQSASRCLLEKLKLADWVHKESFKQELISSPLASSTVDYYLAVYDGRVDPSEKDIPALEYIKAYKRGLTEKISRDLPNQNSKSELGGESVEGVAPKQNAWTDKIKNFFAKLIKLVY